MESPVRSIPVIQIRPNAIIEYQEWLQLGRRSFTSSQIAELEKKLENAYSGQMTDNAAKRLKKAINLLIMSTPRKWMYNPVTQQSQIFHLAFLTLTVSAKHTFLTADEAYNRLLKHFLQWLRRTKKVNSYIWKAELQKRGQIHYHITMGNFVLFNEIRDKWNELQRREGLLDEYYEEHKHYDANSIDIHSVMKIDNLAAYIVKYMAKGTEKDPVMLVDCAKDQPLRDDEIWGAILSGYPANTIAEARTVGKVWDCSTSLKKAKYWNTALEPAHEWTLQKAAGEGLIKTIDGGHYKIHIMKDQNPLEILSSSELERYKTHMEAIRINNSDPDKPGNNC